jgi:hypothetical protein
MAYFLKKSKLKKEFIFKFVSLFIILTKKKPHINPIRPLAMYRILSIRVFLTRLPIIPMSLLK